MRPDRRRQLLATRDNDRRRLQLGEMRQTSPSLRIGRVRGHELGTPFAVPPRLATAPRGTAGTPSGSHRRAAYPLSKLVLLHLVVAAARQDNSPHGRLDSWPKRPRCGTNTPSPPGHSAPNARLYCCGIGVARYVPDLARARPASSDSSRGTAGCRGSLMFPRAREPLIRFVYHRNCTARHGARRLALRNRFRSPNADRGVVVDAHLLRIWRRFHCRARLLLLAHHDSSRRPGRGFGRRHDVVAGTRRRSPRACGAHRSILALSSQRRLCAANPAPGARDSHWCHAGSSAARLQQCLRSSCAHSPTPDLARQRPHARHPSVLKCGTASARRLVPSRRTRTVSASTPHPPAASAATCSSLRCHDKRAMVPAFPVSWPEGLLLALSSASRRHRSSWTERWWSCADP